jgi:hypothetical protein
MMCPVCSWVIRSSTNSEILRADKKASLFICDAFKSNDTYSSSPQSLFVEAPPPSTIRLIRMVTLLFFRLIHLKETKILTADKTGFT